MLPRVCTIACLDCNEPVLDRAQARSTVIAVWFQDEFGLVNDERTLIQLRRLDWVRLATDWMP